MHSWKTASGGSQPERSFLSRLKASPGLRFDAFHGRAAEGRLDAENRLVAVTITATGHRSEFGYDGFGRRVCIRELDPDASQNLQVTSDTKYLWDGVQIAQSRTSDGGTVLQQYFAQGFVDSDGTGLYYTRDHLGSIRELTDGTQSVRARYDYDPYGRMTQLQGDRTSPFTYTGHFWHAQSGLDLTLFRAYDPNFGRWLSRDPIAENGGINLYVYAQNDTINMVDKLGLCDVQTDIPGHPLKPGPTWNITDLILADLGYDLGLIGLLGMDIPWVAYPSATAGLLMSGFQQYEQSLNAPGTINYWDAGANIVIAGGGFIPGAGPAYMGAMAGAGGVDAATRSSSSSSAPAGVPGPGTD